MEDRGFRSKLEDANSMHIRQAIPSDWKRIQDLNRQIFEYELQVEPTSNLEFPYTDEAVSYFKRAAEARDSHAAFVCEDNSDVIGYAIVKLIPPQELTHRVGVRLAQVHTLSVDKAYRGQGIGKRLVAAAREWAIHHGANRMKIVAYAGNDVARGLYRSLGFREFEVAYELEIAKA